MCDSFSWGSTFCKQWAVIESPWTWMWIRLWHLPDQQETQRESSVHPSPSPRTTVTLICDLWPELGLGWPCHLCCHAGFRNLLGEGCWCRSLWRTPAEKPYSTSPPAFPMIQWETKAQGLWLQTHCVDGSMCCNKLLLSGAALEPYGHVTGHMSLQTCLW